MSFLTIDDHRARRLETIPVCVRRKLAECGLTFAEDQWRGLPVAARRRMVAMRVESARERRSFASLVGWLCGTFLQAPALSPRRAPAPWRSNDPPTGSELSVTDWRALSVDGRFALMEAPNSETRHGLLLALAGPSESDTR